MLAYLDPNIHGTLKPRRGRILSLPVETFARVTIRHKKSSATLSVTIISFGIPSAYGERMANYNKLLCAPQRGSHKASPRHVDRIGKNWSYFLGKEERAWKISAWRSRDLKAERIFIFLFKKNMTETRYALNVFLVFVAPPFLVPLNVSQWSAARWAGLHGHLWLLNLRLRRF